MLDGQAIVCNLREGLELMLDESRPIKERVVGSYSNLAEVIDDNGRVLKLFFFVSLHHDLNLSFGFKSHLGYKNEEIKKARSLSRVFRITDGEVNIRTPPGVLASLSGIS